MHSHTRSHTSIFGLSWSPANVALTILLTLLFLIFLLLFLTLTAPPAQGQTYRILYNFTGGQDGAYVDSLIMDRAGNLYGTTRAGGSLTFGTLFKFTRGFLAPLYNFTGTGSGLFAFPWHYLVFGPDGNLYGTEKYGGLGWGTVFKLRPPATACNSVLCPWIQTVLYRFSGAYDGANPTGQLSFDRQGNIYGTTLLGGSGGDCNPSPCGNVYELTPGRSGWTEIVIYNFTGREGAYPTSGIILDADGNLFGSTLGGGDLGDGTVFRLSPWGSGWEYSTIYEFQASDDGYYPHGNLIFDASGNLYGSTGWGGASGAGTVFDLIRLGDWTFDLLYTFTGSPSPNIPEFVNLVMDNAGNLYGTTFSVGAYGNGSVFKLSPGVGGWTYTSLHDFCGDGDPCADGANPASIVIGSAGNLYGIANGGGAHGFGLIWEITP